MAKEEAKKANEAPPPQPKNASTEPIDYMKMVGDAVNWYDNDGKAPMNKLKDDTPFYIKSNPVYKKLAKRFMSGKFKDNALEAFRKDYAKDAIDFEEITEEKEREGYYPNELDSEMEGFKYGD